MFADGSRRGGGPVGKRKCLKLIITALPLGRKNVLANFVLPGAILMSLKNIFAVFVLPGGILMSLKNIFAVFVLPGGIFPGWKNVFRDFCSPTSYNSGNIRLTVSISILRIREISSGLHQSPSSEFWKSVWPRSCTQNASSWQRTLSINRRESLPSAETLPLTDTDAE